MREEILVNISAKELIEKYEGKSIPEILVDIIKPIIYLVKIKNIKLNVIIRAIKQAVKQTISTSNEK